MKIYKNICELIGGTPLLELTAVENENKLNAKIYAKLESFNPAGSAKDRIAAAMLDDAENRGLINRDSLIIEPTSGNTGVGLAAVAASRGYSIVLTMPDTMSAERRGLLKAYGAKLVLTPGSEGMAGAIKKAKEIAQNTPGSFIPGQFDNPANPAAHRASTGPEIWNDTDGQIDIFIAGVGTGGTLTGVGEYLKTKNPDIKIITVEPETSPVLSMGKSGAHGLQGIGAGFVPAVLNTSVYDEVVTVSDAEAFETGRFLAQKEGVLAGISSGAAVFAAIKIAKRPENRTKTIVTLLPDTGERYLSSKMFAEQD